MKFKKIIFILIGVLVTANAFSAEEKDNGVRVNGIAFNIAKDRKIEKIGGLYEPEGIDKYVERRMNQVSEEISKLDAKIEALNHKLEEISAKLSAMPSAPPEKENKTL